MCSRTGIGFLLVSIALLGGCTGLPRQPAVPLQATQLAIPSTCPKARFWPNLDLTPLYLEAAASDERERATLDLKDGSATQLPPAAYLAISGGGDDGAFGAGIMVGWTTSGQRPEFKVVTGVSAGALIAPFAFLGPDYDDVLRKVAVSIGPHDVFKSRTIIGALTGDAFADDQPLASLIDKYVTTEVLHAVAKEYARGRALLIGTTDLDAGQPVFWNMGAIASCQNPAALRLFQQVLLASASIPGVFPPVMLSVNVEGKQYEEMHVDGGVASQIIMFPASFLPALTAGYSINARERSVYIIRNGKLGSPWESVPRRTGNVARSALSALVDTQVINDLYRLELIANQEHEMFNVSFIGEDFNYPHVGMFNADYMKHLFKYGYALAVADAAWHKVLPGESPLSVARTKKSLLENEDR